jgi:predicted transcriptional regulator
MKVRELVGLLELRVAAGADGLDRDIRGGYCGDLLSDVMARAPIGCVWMTVQGHVNTVAVAVLREMAGVILTGGREPDEETLRKADAEAIPILGSPLSSFELAGWLHGLGVGAVPPKA